MHGFVMRHTKGLKMPKMQFRCETGQNEGEHGMPQARKGTAKSINDPVTNRAQDWSK